MGNNQVKRKIRHIFVRHRVEINHFLAGLREKRRSGSRVLQSLSRISLTFYKNMYKLKHYFTIWNFVDTLLRFI